MDRRIQKTRQALQAALISLLREKALEDIEIQEITDTANTARVTFYRHYGKKEELLLDTIEGIYQDFIQHFPVPSLELVLNLQAIPPITPIFAFLEKDRMLYKKLFTGSSSAVLQQRLRQYIVQQVTQSFLNSPQHAHLPIYFIANHIATCIIGNMMWWLSADLPYSAEYIAQITHSMSLTGAMTAVGRGHELTLSPLDLWYKSP